MVKLRAYQEELINNTRKNLKYKKVCVVSPCGSGKSIIQAMIAKMATDKGKNVLFLVHRIELCEQIEETFELCGVNFDLCKIGMVQTIVRRLETIKNPDIIITDETHHSLAKSYLKIYEYFNNSILLGFTATPIRLGGKGLGDIYKAIVVGKSIKWLIENKYLANYRMFSVKLADPKNLHIRQGDYKTEELIELMEKSTIYGDTYDNWSKFAFNKKTIIYCSSIKSSKETIKIFKSKNIKSEHLDGKVDSNERARIIRNFRKGKIVVLSNVGLFGEGFDVPDCECVILLRPTKSLSLYIQQSMRSMRYKEGKEAIIIDHVANCFEHGLPDMERSWTLKDKKKKKNEIEIKECPKCYAVNKKTAQECICCGYLFNTKSCPECETINISSAKFCIKCGYEFPISSVNFVKSELEEIKQETIYKKAKWSLIKELKTLKEIIDFLEARNENIKSYYYQLEERQIKCNPEDFQRLRKLLGYKAGWDKHQIKKYCKDEDYD